VRSKHLAWSLARRADKEREKELERLRPFLVPRALARAGTLFALACAGRGRKQRPCSVCTAAGRPAYLSHAGYERDFDFLCFTVRLRRRNAAAACNIIVKLQESNVGRRRRARARALRDDGGGRDRSIAWARSVEASRSIDPRPRRRHRRRRCHLTTYTRVIPRRPSAYVSPYYVQRPTSVSNRGPMPPLPPLLPELLSPSISSSFSSAKTRESGRGLAHVRRMNGFDDSWSIVSLISRSREFTSDSMDIPWTFRCNEET